MSDRNMVVFHLGADPRTLKQIKRAHAESRARWLAAVAAMQLAGLGEMKWSEVFELVDSGAAPDVVREYQDASREESTLAAEIAYRTGQAP